MGRQSVSAKENTGFLDRGTSITGELRFSGPLRIDGNFHGSILTDDILTVGEHATVRADIKAGEIEIYGCVSGDLAASRRIKVYSTGSVNGDVRVPTFVIESGGTFDGRSQSAEPKPEMPSVDGRNALEGVDEAH